MGWVNGTWGGVEAIYHFGDTPSSHTGMVLVAHGDWGIIALFNVGLLGGMLSSLLSIEQSITGLVDDPTLVEAGWAGVTAR